MLCNVVDPAVLTIFHRDLSSCPDACHKSICILDLTWLEEYLSGSSQV